MESEAAKIRRLEYMHILKTLKTKQKNGKQILQSATTWLQIIMRSTTEKTREAIKIPMAGNIKKFRKIYTLSKKAETRWFFQKMQAAQEKIQ